MDTGVPPKSPQWAAIGATSRWRIVARNGLVGVQDAGRPRQDGALDFHVAEVRDQSDKDAGLAGQVL